MTQQLAVIDNSINEITADYTAAISDSGFGLVPASQLLAAKRQIQKNPYAIKCAQNSPEHLKESVMTAGVLGVDLTEGKRQGWLVPRSVKLADNRTLSVIQFQVGYKGVEAIHQRLGVIDRLSVRVVRKNDTFEWSGDDAVKPSHDADWFNEKSRGEVIGCYCVTYFPDGSLQTVTAPLTEIYEKHRDKSDSWKNENARKYSPWSTHPEQMILKTMVYIAAKQWPALKQSENDQTSHILERLHQTEVADYQEMNRPDRDQRYDVFFDMMDGIGMYLLNREYLQDCPDEEQEKNHSIWMQFWDRFAEGTKGKLKQRETDLVNEGREGVELIVQHIENKDSLGVAEVLEGITVQGKRMLAKYLGEDLTAQLKELIA